jgi:DNA-binding Lrp family transcriptional regulator
MKAKRISIMELEKAVQDGLNVTQTARRLGCSKGGVSKRLKALKIAVVKDSVLQHAGEIVEKRLDAIDQIKKINDYANELLDLLMRWNRGDDTALQILESQVRKVKIRGTEKEIEEYKFKDPRELALMAMREIRGQIQLQFEIFQGLYDMQAVAEFQKEVLNAIGKCSPELKQQIVEELKKGGSIRSVLELP